MSRRRGFFSGDIFRIARDTILFLAGLIGVFYETVFTQADRPTLLLLYAAMLGLPAFLHSDERNKNDDEVEIRPRPKNNQNDTESDDEDYSEPKQNKSSPKRNTPHKHEAPGRRRRVRPLPDEDG